MQLVKAEDAVVKSNSSQVEVTKYYIPIVVVVVIAVEDTSFANMDPITEAVNGNASTSKDTSNARPSAPLEDHINIHECVSHCVKTLLKVTST
jgi:hypothetical protein